MEFLPNFEGKLKLENAPEHAAFGCVEFYGVFGKDEGDLTVFGDRSDAEVVGEKLALHKGYLRFRDESGNVLIKILLRFQDVRPGLDGDMSVFPVTVQSIEVTGEPGRELEADID